MITEEQRKERVNYVGSSDAAAVLGLSRWRTPLEVWAIKTGAIQPEDLSNKLAFEVGNELEDLCAKLFEKRTGKKTHRVNETIYHPSHAYIAANLDRRVVGEDALLECKTAGAWAAKDWAGEDMPQEVIIQVMHQLMVTGKSYGYACILIGGNQDFIWKRLDRDPLIIAEMLKKERDFWIKYVETKTPPQATKLDGDVLFKLFPNAPAGSEIALGDEANRILESLEGLLADYKSLEGVIEKEKNVLKEMLGSNEIGLTDRYRISWKNQTTVRLDTQKLKEEKPRIVEEYSKSAASRVFRYSKIKIKEAA